MTGLIVAKFGGTSVADYDAMSRCASIVASNPETKIVVVSASSGVTNYLVRLAKGNLPTNERDAILAHIADIEFSILKKMGHKPEMAQALEHLLNELSACARDAELASSLALQDELLSFGERMSSLLFSEILREQGTHAINFDVRQVIKTDASHSKATPDIALIKHQAETLLMPELAHSVIVTQGFIGASDNGKTTTLGRGGSDYSAALLAESVKAEALQIWTDVNGIYTTDPRLTAKARPINEISFDEAAEMATFGAKILHPATLVPAMRASVRVFVGSSRQPEAGGTWVAWKTEHKPAYRAIALRKEQVLLTLKSPDMLHATGFLADVFTILARHKISVDLITTSEISVALTLDEPTNGNSRKITETLLDELKAVGEVTVEENLSLIAVIGNHLQATRGVGGNVLSALEKYNLRMICHGASAHNLCFLVQSEDAPGIVEHLHSCLFD
ncbi:lysine-sensitive aspartokinase 3 [Planctobacterium marinum]|uniref:Aspartokinase n=1 Tax=Planctobacterium marinum TaxID=1631968 RepID=A0AA48I5L5_9ALTE|nr:aspartokinase [Planctobacterium marinum]